MDFVPGTKWRYSGGGVTIEQLAMTDVSGKHFPALMKETVLDKIRMSDSSYEQPLPAAWAARTAVGTYASGKSVHGKWHVYPEMAAAGLWTTPTDLAKFVIEIALSKQGKSNKVLTQKTVDEMFTHPPSAPDFGIGIGLAASRPGEFGHDGADEGFQAMLVMNAEGSAPVERTTAVPETACPLASTTIAVRSTVTVPDEGICGLLAST